MRISVILLCGAALLMVSAQVAVEAAPNCTCRFQGQDFQLGQSACINTANGPRMARCVRVLNNTSWEVTKGACPFAQAPEDDNSLRSMIARAGAPTVSRSLGQ